METVAEVTLRFARAAPAELVAGITALMQAHWEEVEPYRDLPLDIDFDKYARLESQGCLRCYGAWRDTELVGYAVWILGTALHYRAILTAQESAMYIAPRARSFAQARAFDAFIEAALRTEGVEIATRHVKARDSKRAAAHVFWLRRQSYQLQDIVLTKRLSWPG